VVGVVHSTRVLARACAVPVARSSAAIPVMRHGFSSVVLWIGYQYRIVLSKLDNHRSFDLRVLTSCMDYISKSVYSFHDLLNPVVEKNIGTDEQRAGSCLDQAHEGGVDFAVGACFQYLNL